MAIEERQTAEERVDSAMAKIKRATWRQISGQQFENEAPAGRHIWISDGVLGFTRPLAEAETIERAVTDFESAGEPADDIRIYENGEMIDWIR